jgi:hypothetical protein
VELGVLGPLQVRQYGLPVAVPGAKSRAILTMLGLHGGSVVSADTFLELLWGEDPPRTAAKALQTPNVWVEPAETLKCSASGAVGDMLVKGTSPDGVEVEIPMLMLGLFDGDHLTRFELFDPEQRDLALARFDELNRPA